MGVIQAIDRLMTNPIPDGQVDDILRPQGRVHCSKGLRDNQCRCFVELGAYRFDVANDLWFGLLCR